MFTGIVTDIGRIRRVAPGGDVRFEIACRYAMDSVAIGASIACSGVCLTVIEKGPDWFAVTASQETLGASTAKHWREGAALNLERALKVGDELGGHIVQGHVDGVAKTLSIVAEGQSWRMQFALPPSLAPYVAPKGSVALDGVSLTVNEVVDRDGGTIFGINVIPHTYAHTTFGSLTAGAEVNVEIDVLARYVARLNAMKG